MIVNELGIVDTEDSVLADLDFDEFDTDDDHDFQPVAV